MGCAHLIILAGGSGERLRRVTRAWTGESIPKQFCRFVGGRSLLEWTLDRLGPWFAPDRIRVVVTGRQQEVARAQLSSVPRSQMVVQPLDRGTAAGALVGLLEVAALDATGPVVITPADHALRDPDALAMMLQLACARVRQRPDQIVVIGVEPDAPRSDLGWIVREPCPPGSFGRVVGFEEKPSTRRARELMAQGACFNTLILAGVVSTFLDLFRTCAPALLIALTPMVGMPNADRPAFLARVFERIPSVDLSRDLLARAENLVACRLVRSVGWTDLGDEERLLAWLESLGEFEAAGRLRRLLQSSAADNGVVVAS